MGFASRRTLATNVTALIGLLGTIGVVGNTYYVDSVAGVNAAGRGDKPSRALASVDYAIGLCTANNGDVIIQLPGHVEAITAASTITVDVAGIRIVGAGTGRSRPVWTWGTSTAATVVVSVANVTFENCVFDVTGIDAVVTGFSCDAADDIAFLDSEFITNSGTTGCVTAITLGTTTACNRWRIERCHFWGPATNSGTTTTAQVTYTKGTDFIFRNNLCTGKMTQSITNGAAVLRGWIDGCRFTVYTGTKAINCHASSTPSIFNCRFNVPSGTAPIVAAAGFVAGNVYSAAAGVTAGTASTF